MRGSKGPVLAVLVITTLSACGGGGNSNTPPKQENAASGATISGGAVKGVIKGGLVEAYPIANGEVGSTPLALTTTQADGRYTLQTPSDYAGPVLLIVKDNAEASATVTCDVPDGCGSYAFGDDMPMGTLRLEALLADTDPGEILTGSLTPLTHMAAAYAKHLGLNATNIDMANGKVGKLFGVSDIVGTIPPDITDPAVTSSNDTDSNELSYALIGAATATLAQNNFNGDVAAILDNLSQTYTNNGGELVGHESSDDPTTISLQELAQKATDIADTLSQNNDYAGMNSGAATSLTQLAGNAGDLVADTLTATPDASTAGQNEFAKVKAFTADVRTWGHVITAQAKADTNPFASQWQLAGNMMQEDSKRLLLAMSDAVWAGIQAIDANAPVSNLSDYLGDPLNTLGTITYDREGQTLDIDGAIDGQTIVTHLKLPDAIATQFTLEIASFSASNNTFQLQVSQGSIVVNFDREIDVVQTYQNSLTLPRPDQVSFQLDATLQQQNVDNPVSFEGTMAATLVTVRNDSGIVVSYNPKTLAFSGRFSNTLGDSIRLTLNGIATNFTTFVQAGPVPLFGVRPGIVSYNIDADGNAVTFTFADYVYNNTLHATRVSWNPSTYEITADNGQVTWLMGYNPNSLTAYFRSLKDQWLPVSSEGYYSFSYGKIADDILSSQISGITTGYSQDGQLELALPSGDLSYEDSNNYLTGNVSLGFDLTLDELPKASFLISGNRSGYKTGDMSLTISYEARSLTSTVSVVDGTRYDGHAVIRNQEGIELTLELTDGDITGGHLVYAGKTYGVIRISQGIPIISYADGSIESI